MREAARGDASHIEGPCRETRLEDQKEVEAVEAGELSRGIRTALIVDYPITLVATVQQKRKDLDATSAESMDTLRLDASNNRKPRALSMRGSLIGSA
jgi:hypothetical protein